MKFNKKATIYGGGMPQKFDQYVKRTFNLTFDSRTEVPEPSCPEYQKTKEFIYPKRIQIENDAYSPDLFFSIKSDLTTYQIASLADISLRTRGLIGLMLGSNVKRFLSPPPPKSVKTLHKHFSDLDILILNKFDENHPKPNEFGADWFVRPNTPPRRPKFNPTNGAAICCYDLSIKPKIQFSTEPVERNPKLPMYFDYESLKFKYKSLPENLSAQIIGTTRQQIKNHIFQPGLYLASPETLNQIADHSENYIQKNAQLYNEIIDLHEQFQYQVTNNLSRGLNISCLILLKTFLKKAKHLLRIKNALFRNPETALRHVSKAAFISRFSEVYHEVTKDKLEFELEEILHALQINKEYSKSGYDYLRPAENCTNALFPIFPHSALKFTDHHNQNLP